MRRKFGRVGVLKIDDDTRFIAPPEHDYIAELIETCNTRAQLLVPTSTVGGMSER
jgi:hypothetical protein